MNFLDEVLLLVWLFCGLAASIKLRKVFQLRFGATDEAGIRCLAFSLFFGPMALILSYLIDPFIRSRKKEESE